MIVGTVEQGRVVNVTDRILGSVLVSDTLIGATSITVEKPGVFDEDGGQLIIDRGGTNQEVATYTSVADDTGVIAVAALTLAHTADDPVELYSISQSPPVVSERVAHVVVQEADDEIMTVRIPFEQRDRWALGIRDPGDEESVLIELYHGDWLIVDVPGKIPRTEGEFLPPDPSDGLPPASSPLPTVKGFIRSLWVTWTPIANVDQVTYEVHVSATSGFTPDSNSKAGEVVASGQFSINRLPPAGSDLSYGTTYYVKLIARDTDGSAPASAEASGQLVEINSPDIAADSIFANHIAAGEIKAEHLEAIMAIVNELRTAESGQRVQINSQGIAMYDPLEAIVANWPTVGEAFMRGTLEATYLTVIQALTLRGLNNILDNGAVLTMRNKIQTSQAKPTMASDWDKQTLTPPSETTGQHSFCYDGSGFGSQPTYLVGDYYPGQGGNIWKLREYKVADFSLLRSYDSLAWGQVYGVTRMGSHIYVLYRFVNLYYIRKLNQSDLTQVSNTEVTSFIGAPGGGAALGNDGTNLLLAYFDVVANDKSLKVRKLDTSLASVSVTTCTGKLYAAYAVAKGIVFAESAWWFQRIWDYYPGYGVHKFSTAGAYQANEDFDVGVEALSLTHDGTKFYELVQGTGGKSTIYHHTTWTWTSESGLYWVKYTWFKDNAPAGRGAEDYETMTSPANSILHKRKSKMIITTPDFPATVTHASIYIERGATEPADTTFNRQTDSSSKTATLTTFNTGGAAPPTSSNFPLGTASAIKSDDGSPLLRADGISRVRVDKTTSQSLSASVDTHLTSWDSVETDTDTYWNAANSRITIPFTGQYLLVLRVVYVANSTGARRYARWFKSTDGGFNYSNFEDFIMPPLGSASTRVIFASVASFNAGDMLRVHGFTDHTSGTLGTNAKLAVVFLGPG